MDERLPRFRRVKPRPFILTSRDRRMVELVEEFRLLSSEQVIALLGDGSGQQVLRRLQLLYHARFLDRPRSQIVDLVRSPGSRPMVYALGSAGAALLGVKLPKQVGLEFIDHTLGVASVLAAFTLSCRKHGDVRVIPWREILEEKVPEETRRKKQPDSWRVRLSGGPMVGITPDAIFGLHYLAKPEGANRSWFFLEVDRGTMPVMRKRLSETSVYRKLLAYHATAEQALQTELFGMKTFRVLTVTTGEKRLASLVEAAKKLPSLHGLYFFSDEESFLKGGTIRGAWVNGRGKEVPI
ncbi:MAG TPA: replication-relaxation family protein [Thermoanaerobaculia bacterium]|nr:replication-relaxation family protein [Thermoanaerobaculia bacterium]